MDQNPIVSNEIDPKVAALLAYLFGWISGPIFFAFSRNNFVKFHAIQSTLFAIAATIIFWLGFSLLPSLMLGYFSFIGWPLVVASIVVWIILIVKAYRGESYKLPLLGKLAEKYANR